MVTNKCQAIGCENEATVVVSMLLIELCEKHWNMACNDRLPFETEKGTLRKGSDGKLELKKWRY